LYLEEKQTHFFFSSLLEMTSCKYLFGIEMTEVS
jgi:hypothetical protein